MRPRWRSQWAPADAWVEQIHRFGGGYFASSFRGRSGPFASMDDALLALTGERRIPVTSGLRRIHSTDWTEEEIQERMRIVEPAAAPAAIPFL